MFEIGATLREARERRGLTAEDVHRSLRIRARYLQALEDERWELLPGEAYAKGFLRSYAEFLGLEGSLFVDELKARIALRDAEPVRPDFRRRRRPRLLGRAALGWR